MKLSTKGRYVITAMLDLALNADDKQRVTLADISEFQGLSISYLEQLFGRLRQAGLVKGTRGPGGGYRLARSPDDITIAEIVAAVDEKTGKEKALKLDDRHQKTQELWEKLSHHIADYLSSITLADLLSEGQPGEGQSDTGDISFAKREMNALNIWSKTESEQAAAL